MHIIQLALVITVSFVKEMASTGQTVPHVPHSLQEGRESGVAEEGVLVL